MTTQTGIFLRVSVLTQKDSRRRSGAALAASAKLKSLFVSQKIKEIAALDRHETHGVDNLLSIHFQHHQRRETRLFSLGNPGKDPRYLFFPQTNKHSGISKHSLQGNDMFVGVLGTVSQRFNDPQVGLDHGRKQKSLGLGSEKTNVTGKEKKPDFNGLSNYRESDQGDLIKAPVKFTP